MSDVEFDDSGSDQGSVPKFSGVRPQYGFTGMPVQPASFVNPNSPFFVRLIMKTGLVKDERQANYILIGIAVAFFAISIYFFFF